MSKAKSDIRPLQAIPAEGQETHDGWSGFIPEEKFSNQGSLPYKGSDLEWKTRSGMQGASNIIEIRDSGPNPNTPSVAEMRASQEAGGKGKGTADQTMNESQADFNMGTSLVAGDDETSD